MNQAAVVLEQLAESLIPAGRIPFGLTANGSAALALEESLLKEAEARRICWLMGWFWSCRLDLRSDETTKKPSNRF